MQTLWPWRSDDPDAALKFILETIFSDGRFAQLAHLRGEASEFQGMSGDPGWELERRASTDEDWPEWAMYKAFVDPDEFTLDVPMQYISSSTFESYVEMAIAAYCVLDPNRRPELEALFRVA